MRAATLLAWTAGALLCLASLTPAQDASSVCALCHGDVEPAGGAGGRGLHAELSCLDCHASLRGVDFAEAGEHEVPLPPADCAACHAEEAERAAESAHASEGVGCTTCHGGHGARRVHDPDAPVALGRLNALCTACHRSVAGAAPGDVHALASGGRTCLSCHDAHAAAPPAALAGDESCLACHGDGAADAARGLVERKGPDGPPGAVAESAHGRAGVRCVLCHDALLETEAYPHGPVAEVDCGKCHTAELAAHARGVHAREGEGGRAAAGCRDCHGGHDVRAPEDPRSSLFPLALPDTCERCHRPDSPSDHLAPGGAAAAAYETSVHGRALRESGLVVTATCRSCHGSHEILPAGDPESATSRRHVPYTCGACHAGILSGYLSGVHGADFLAGVEDVPVCTDCHGEHAIEDPMLAGSSVSHELVAETCARCHADVELASSYGFRFTSFLSWGRSYHGIAMALGEERAANCASCHGHHEIHPASDPRSSIHPDNVEATCGRCHEDASAAFARVPVHSVIELDGNPAAWVVQALYQVLIAAIIGGFVLLIGVDLFGRIRLRLGVGPREELAADPALLAREDELFPPGEEHVRMNVPARIQHGVLILSFALLVATGLPLFVQDLPLAGRILDFEGAYRLRGSLHRAGAVGLIGLSVWHVAALLLSGTWRRWFGSMWLRWSDVQDFARGALFSLGITDWIARRGWFRGFFERHPRWRASAPPLIGRYGLVEKLEYLAVVWGNAVMIATGFVLWRPGWFLGRLPAFTFDLCRIVHGYEATLAFLAIVVWHMYHVHLRPGAFPMSRAWLTGRISRGELRHHHPAEYLAILETRRARAAASGSSTAPRDPREEHRT